MVSLGNLAYCGTLRSNDRNVELGTLQDNDKCFKAGALSVSKTGDIQTTGSIQASHKVLGGDVMNQGEIHHLGSLFYLKWSAVHQIASIETWYPPDTDLSSNIELTTTANHGLTVGDTIHIGSIPNQDVDNVNGIPITDIVKTHVVFSVTNATKFKINTTLATTQGMTTIATPHVRIDRYKYIDMSSNAVSWTNQTTLPTPSYTNTEYFYF